MHQLKGDLDWIVMKCLEKDRTRRYETANGLAADLKRHLNNEPVVARPPSRPTDFRKRFAGTSWSLPPGPAVAVALVARHHRQHLAGGARHATPSEMRWQAQASEAVQREKARSQ